MFIKDLKEFRKYLQYLNDCDNNNLARNVKYGFCNDFYGTNSYVHDHEMKVHQSKTAVEKNLYKLLANSTYGKFVETGLKRMKMKFATTWNEREAIIAKHDYEMIAGTTIYSENLIGIKLNTGVKGGETILHWIYHSRYVQTHHIRFLLQRAENHIR